MKDLDRFDDRTWRRFLAFVVPDEEGMKCHEVRAELQHLGIDTRPGVEKIQRLLEQTKASYEAQAALEEARRRRPSLIAKLYGIASEVGNMAREDIRRIIQERFSGTEQAAFFRKLESAASEEDLRSLLEDMSRLDTMEEDSEDVGT